MTTSLWVLEGLRNHAGSLLALAWSAGVFATSVTAAARSVRPRIGAGRRGATISSGVVLIRPCAGAEPELERTLSSTAELGGVERCRVVFAVADERDGAYPIALATSQWLRERGIDASVWTTHPRGPNLKASQIQHVLDRCAHEVVVVADSDVDLSGVELGQLVGPILADEAALVWVPPVEDSRDATFGDRASMAVLGASLHAFPVLAGLDPTGVVGKLFAIKTRELERAGGFATLTGVLGEDVELGRRLQERGKRTLAAPVVVRARPRGRSFRVVTSRFGRWLSVVRAQRPALLLSYPLLFFPTLPLLLLSLLASALWLGLAIAGLAITARVLVAIAALSASRRRVALRDLAFAPLADVVLLVAWLRALASRRVEWRGQQLRLSRRGELQRIAA